MGCIYLITCLSTGEYYVGKTLKNKEERWSEHKSEAKAKRYNSHLHKAMNKRGFDNFVIEVLTESDNEQELFNFEKLWIISLNSIILGFNLTSGGDGASGRIFKHTEETKLKLSKLLTGRTVWNKGKYGYKVGSYNIRFGKDNPFFGLKHTEESKSKMRLTKLRNKGIC